MSTMSKWKKRTKPGEPPEHRVKVTPNETYKIPDGEEIHTLKFVTPPGLTVMFRISLEGHMETTAFLSADVSACRTMMRGTEEERKFARRNHSPTLVEYVEWEIAAEQGKKNPDGVAMFGASDRH